MGELPEPVLFNAWKHHAGFLHSRIAEAAAGGGAGLAGLAARLVVLGTELMDLYTGALTPEQIAGQVLAALRAGGLLERDAYRDWVVKGGGYQVLSFGDGTRWVLRLGDEAGRYVHVHPARWAPETRRVRANVLKTAVMVLACAGALGGDPLDVALVNRVRRQYLGLSPVGRVAGDQGLRVVIDLLRSP